MVGKLLNNKKADTIIQAITDFWRMSLGFPTSGFFAGNGGEFSNIKLDELTNKLGTTVKFGLAYSPWSNGINERNHASVDLTIKKLMKKKKVQHTDSLVKAAAWTHNTSINKLGYSPLQLVTGKAVVIPGLTTGNVATESKTITEAIQRTIKNLTRIISEFRESDMRQKLEDCQDFWISSSNHTGGFIEGDKVRFQPFNGNF